MLFVWLFFVWFVGSFVSGHNATARGCGRKFCGVATGRSLTAPVTRAVQGNTYNAPPSDAADTVHDAPVIMATRACGHKFCNLTPKRGCGRKYCATATAKRALDAISDQFRDLARAGCGRKCCGVASARRSGPSNQVSSLTPRNASPLELCDRSLAGSGTLLARCCDRKFCGGGGGAV